MSKYPNVYEYHEYKLLQQVEPTQLRLFNEVLSNLKTESKPVMMELGCADAVYSRLFYDFFNGDCINVNVELRSEMIEIAKDMVPNATVLHGVVGIPLHIQESWPSREEDIHARTIPLTELFNYIGDKRVSILHMDLQGSEISVFEELIKDNLFGNIKYIFCSLHGTYERCIELLNNISGYNIRYLFEHPTEGGFGDGLIVCQILEKNS